MNSFKIIIELILLVQFTKCNELTVNTSCGMLSGRKFKSRNGRIVATFNGIPYAKPPIGNLRFQDPQPADPWTGVREAYNFGSVCVQKQFLFPPVNTTKMGNEDCLYLSVYSSDLKPTNLLPVLFFLHGGEMFSRSGEIDKTPEFFLDHDLLVVMVNYRLGVLGFLTTEDDVMPGNMALKDQNMALEWVQNNIANFGGDPKQVTLIGDTSGATFVNFHMYSPMSRGLFHRAISQTGTALAAWASTPPGVARSRAIKMAQLFNCSTESSIVILDCLRTKNAYELTESYSKFLEIQMDPAAVFVPICDKNAKNPFLPFNPHDAEPVAVPWIVGLISTGGVFRSGGSSGNAVTLKFPSNYDYIVTYGSTAYKLVDNQSSWTSVIPASRPKSQRAFVLKPDFLTEFDEKFLQITPISMMYDNIVTNPEEFAKEIREFYFGDQPITMSLYRNITDMYTDAYYNWPAVESLQKHTGPHYVYYFDYLGEHSYQEILAGERLLPGSCAFDDTIYTWRIKNPFEIPPPSTSQDLYISNLLVKLFYNFASLGEPTPSGFDFTWPQWDNKEQNFITIGNSGVTLNSSLLPERMEFWSQLNYKYNLEGN